MTLKRHPARIALAVVIPIALPAGCAPRGTPAGAEVTRAWSDPIPAAPDAPVESGGGEPSTSIATLTQPQPPGESIATINGTPVFRDRFLDILVDGHGLALLEQLVVLEAARQLAADRNLTVTQEDRDRTYHQALARLAGPAASTQSVEQRQALGERLLADFLRKKNISRIEYMLGIERTAYLEKIVAPECTPTEDELRAEYERQYGEKIQVRHIQLQTLDDVQQVRQALEAGGRFEAVARQYSQNFETALAGGQLPPFTRDDPDVPRIFAVTGFSLEPGQISAPIQDGPWYHILKLERRFPPSSVEFRHVREQLVEPARRRRMEPEIQRLAERLFNEARVTILDPKLRAKFEKKYGRNARGGF